VRTEAGKMMPINLDVEVVTEKGGEKIVVAKPHWASCPNAKDFRKKNTAPPKMKEEEDIPF